MKRIVQIEFTNNCNRCCLYCGQTNMKRERGFISKETLSRCIYVLKALKQEVVGINHYGESLMHPDVVELIETLNCNGIIPWIYTNGDFLSDELIHKLSKLKLTSLTISGHAEKERRIELFQKCSAKGIISYWQGDVNDGASNLAGQVDFDSASDKFSPPLKEPMIHCRFLAEQNAIVLFNGDLVPCCFDYDGIGIFGSIYDNNVLDKSPVANKLCQTCPGHPGNVV